MLAIMDHNANLERKKIGEYTQFSKASKTWVIRDRYEPKSTNWRDDIMENVTERIDNEEVKIFEDADLLDKPSVVPHNIATVSGVAEETVYTRF
jgi:hypothetical protein